MNAGGWAADLPALFQLDQNLSGDLFEGLEDALALKRNRLDHGFAFALEFPG
jgi:hypothetical protein